LNRHNSKAKDECLLYPAFIPGWIDTSRRRVRFDLLVRVPHTSIFITSLRGLRLILSMHGTVYDQLDNADGCYRALCNNWSLYIGAALQ